MFLHRGGSLKNVTIYHL